MIIINFLGARITHSIHSFGEKMRSQTHVEEETTNYKEPKGEMDYLANLSHPMTSDQTQLNGQLYPVQGEKNLNSQQ